MYKKMKLLILMMSVMCILTACGGSSVMDDLEPKSVGYDGMSAQNGNYGVVGARDGSYGETGGDYSNAHISGSDSDYSYSFGARGETNKSKEEMLRYYEDVQSFVDSKGGYISDVNNDYYYHDIDNDKYHSSDDYRYLYSGNLSFNVEIDNKYISEVLDILDNMCKENGFTVYQYDQDGRNYENYEVTETETNESETITQEELDKRLKYASLDVNISYNCPRFILAKWFYEWRDLVIEFFDAAKGTLFVALIFVLFLVITLFGGYIPVATIYKMFVKMKYKNRLKHPEYYGIKRYLVIENAEKDDVKENKAS